MLGKKDRSVVFYAISCRLEMERFYQSAQKNAGTQQPFSAHSADSRLASHWSVKQIARTDVLENVLQNDSLLLHTTFANWVWPILENGGPI